MKKKMLALMMLAGATLLTPAAFGEFSVGFSIGAPPPPYYRGYYARPPLPGPGYAWIDDGWFVDGGRYAWRNGYWGHPPYAGAYWVAPRYYGGRYFNGYWGGDRDRDGIPNRFDNYDNRYRGAWDRDRDGVADRYDRYDNRRGNWDRDRYERDRHKHDRRDGYRGRR